MTDIAVLIEDCIRRSELYEEGDLIDVEVYRPQVRVRYEKPLPEGGYRESFHVQLDTMTYNVTGMITVHPDYQGRGEGKRLANLVRDIAAELGWKEVFVHNPHEWLLSIGCEMVPDLDDTGIFRLEDPSGKLK